MHGALRPFRWVIAFTATYMLASLIAALARRNFEFLFYVGTMAVIVAAIAIMHVRVTLSRGVVWALSLWGLAHLAGGLVPLPAGWPHEPPNAVLYSLWLVPGYLKYDHVVHAYGFGVTAWLCWEGLRAVTGRRSPTPGILMLVAAAALGFGALNEVVEFIATLVMPTTNVGGYENTGWDLVANLVGAVAAAVLIAVTSRWDRSRG